MKKLPVVSLLVFWCSMSTADQLILKDGKIINGQVLDESKDDILIRDKITGKPMLISVGDVLSKQIDPPQPKPKLPPDPKRYIQVQFGVNQSWVQANELNSRFPTGLQLLGGFRAHPSFELEGGVSYKPAFSGDLTIEAEFTPGITTRRSYRRFSEYEYGFSVKLYPFRYQWGKPLEPYVILGYDWSWFLPKGTSDKLTGSGWRAGIGLLKQVKGQWYVDSRLAYQAIGYKDVTFLGQEGTFTNTVKSNNVLLQLSLMRKW